MEDMEKEAWIAWRDDLIEAVKDLIERFSAIRESQELAGIKTMLEVGPILIDRETFKRALRFH